MNYFKVVESPYSIKGYVITGTDPFYDYFGWQEGSFHVLQARIMGLNYASYLRMGRDLYGGQIEGKNHFYPTLHFKEEKSALKLANELNRRLNFLIEREKNTKN